MPGIRRIGLGSRGGASWKPTNAELVLYMTGLTTPLSVPQQQRLDTFITSLKTGLSISALSDAFDTFYILAGETEESSLRNLVKNLHNCDKVNAPAWVQYEGFTGNGTTSYLKTNYKAGTQADKYLRDDSSSGVYVRKNIAESRAVCGWFNASTIGTHIIPRTVSTAFNTALNSAHQTTANGTVSDARGWNILSRLSSTGYKGYKNKVLFHDVTVDSAAPSDFEDFIGCWNNKGTAGSFSTQQVAARFIGKGLTIEENNIIVDAFETYMDANNRAVINIPAMVFSFDDGYISNHSKGLGLFSSTKPMTVYYTTGEGYVDRSLLMSVAQLKELRAAGHDVQCHTHTHPSLSTLTEEQVLAEYDNVNTFFTSNGLPSPIHTAYPFYDNAGSVKTYTATKRTTARAGAPSNRIDPTSDKYDLKAYVLDSDKDDRTLLDIFLLAMAAAVTENKSVICLGHRIYEDTDPAWITSGIQRSFVEEVLTYADTVGLRVMTISQLIRHWNGFTVTT